MKCKEFLENSANLTEKALEKYLPESKEEYKIVADAMRYSLLGGGKRIRAALCLEFCRVCGGNTEDALPFACAVEMIHAYSLIHDDLPCMDNDDMRRGKPSCHKAFTEDMALLAGDALQPLAFETIFTAKNVKPENIIRAANVLAKAAGYNGMVGGQVLDLDAEGKEISYQTLLNIETLKTGALISSACEMGCIVADADDEKIAAAKSYAAKIGRVFQMIDDVLDVTADEEELGKPVGSDEENLKTTYVSMFGIEKTCQMAEELTNEAINDLKVFGDEAEMLKELAILLLHRKK